MLLNNRCQESSFSERKQYDVSLPRIDEKQWDTSGSEDLLPHTKKAKWEQWKTNCNIQKQEPRKRNDAE